MWTGRERGTGGCKKDAGTEGIKKERGGVSEINVD